MNFLWLMRMKQWARNPPPMWKVKLVLGVVAACGTVVVLQWAGYWPDALTLQKMPRGYKP